MILGINGVGKNRLNDVYEADKAAHGDRPNTPSNEEYGYMMMEESHDQEDINDAAYEKYIGADIIMGGPGEVPRRVTVRRCVEDLNGGKKWECIIGIHSWLIESTSWNMKMGHMVMKT